MRPRSRSGSLLRGRGGCRRAVDAAPRRLRAQTTAELGAGTVVNGPGNPRGADGLQRYRREPLVREELTDLHLWLPGPPGQSSSAPPRWGSRLPSSGVSAKPPAPATADWPRAKVKRPHSSLSRCTRESRRQTEKRGRHASAGTDRMPPPAGPFIARRCPVAAHSSHRGQGQVEPPGLPRRPVRSAPPTAGGWRVHRYSGRICASCDRPGAQGARQSASARRGAGPDGARPVLRPVTAAHRSAVGSADGMPGAVRAWRSSVVPRPHWADR